LYRFQCYIRYWFRMKYTRPYHECAMLWWRSEIWNQ
jgi:hypothetical protein